MKRIMIAVDGFSENHLNQIKNAAANWGECVRIDESTNEGDYRTCLSRTQIVVGWPQPHWMLESPVEYLQLASAGYEAFQGLGLCEKTGVLVCNIGGELSCAVADHFVAMMCCLTRGLHHHIADKELCRWQRLERYGEISGSTVCIVGMGSIGGEISKRCQGLGMQVLGVGRHPETMPSKYLDKKYSWSEIPKALSFANHVVLCFPGSPENNNMFNAKMFGYMRSGAFFYNIARGSIVEESALLDALNSRHLAGAGLDVFRQEPLPSDHPFWELDNVLITPHAAGRSESEYNRICALFCENLIRLNQGLPLMNQIQV